MGKATPKLSFPRGTRAVETPAVAYHTADDERARSPASTAMAKLKDEPLSRSSDGRFISSTRLKGIHY